MGIRLMMVPLTDDMDGMLVDPVTGPQTRNVCGGVTEKVACCEVQW